MSHHGRVIIDSEATYPQPMKVVRVGARISLDQAVAQRMTNKVSPHVTNELVYKLADEIVRHCVKNGYVNIERQFNPSEMAEVYTATIEVGICLGVRI